MRRSILLAERDLPYMLRAQTSGVVAFGPSHVTLLVRTMTMINVRNIRSTCGCVRSTVRGRAAVPGPTVPSRTVVRTERCKLYAALRLMCTSPSAALVRVALMSVNT
jgi:hypothetical protein